MTLPYLGESRGEIHQLVWEPSSMTADATLIMTSPYLSESNNSSVMCCVEG